MGCSRRVSSRHLSPAEAKSHMRVNKHSEVGQKINLGNVSPWQPSTCEAAKAEKVQDFHQHTSPNCFSTQPSTCLHRYKWSCCALRLGIELFVALRCASIAGLWCCSESICCYLRGLGKTLQNIVWIASEPPSVFSSGSQPILMKIKHPPLVRRDC
jgi:hypothetical protein